MSFIQMSFLGAIMKTKKTTIWMILISILVLIVIAILFATSGKNNSEENETKNKTESEIGSETESSSHENETESVTVEEETKVETSSSERVEESVGIVAEDIEVHELVKYWAIETVLESFERENYDKILYTNWKIDNIVQVGVYTNDEHSVNYEIYSIEYKLLSMDTDEWITVTGENVTYLVLDRTTLTNNGSRFGHVLHTVCGPKTEDIIYYIQVHLKSMHDEYEMVYIHDMQETKIILDKLEWVTVPSDRAMELGFTVDNCPNGYTMYNEETILEEYTVSEDCIYVIQDAMFARINVNQETFKTHIEEKEEKYKWRNPYRVIIEDYEIVAIFEQYVP